MRRQQLRVAQITARLRNKMADPVVPTRVNLLKEVAAVLMVALAVAAHVAAAVLADPVAPAAAHLHRGVAAVAREVVVQQ